jgi:hypothetical protein
MPVASRTVLRRPCDSSVANLQSLLSGLEASFVKEMCFEKFSTPGTSSALMAIWSL